MAAASEVSADSPPETMANWITSLSPLMGAEPQAPKEEPKEEKPNASKAPDGKPGDSPGAVAPVGEPDKKGDGAPDPAAAAPKPADAKAAEAAEDKSKHTEPESAEEKWPRTKQDWEKFKESRKKSEDKFRSEIDQREASINDLKSQLAAATEKASKIPEVSPADKAEMESLKKENEEMSRRLQVLDVTQHPRFQSYFSNKTNAQIALAKRIVGEERSDDIEKALALPDTPEYKEIKEERIAEIISELSPVNQSRIGSVLNSLAEIDQERQSEIDKAKENREKALAAETTQREEQRKQITAATEAALGEGLKRLQDPKNGSPLFQYREGNDQHNALVKHRIDLARKLFYGDNELKPEAYVQAAFSAAAFPDVIRSYRAEMQAAKTEIDKLREQVKGLSAAQPKGGESVETPASGAVEPKAKLNSTMSPMDVTAQWLKNGPWGNE